MSHYDDEDELLATATRAMAAGPDGAALDGLGWWDLLADLDDPDTRHAVIAAFRAQGRALAASPALGGLMAQPLVEGTAIPVGTVVAAIERSSPRRGRVWVVVGDVGDRRLLFDEPGRGLFVLDPAAVTARPVQVPGQGSVQEVTVDLAALTPTAPEVTAPARARSLALGRLAAAAEILGAAEGAVALAVQHATDREQFGRPIGAFQAVRHLLAWARTDCVAVEAAVHQGVALLHDPPPRHDEVTKALAGRNGRRACERSLQVLGGIGFTAEHPHHHHHSRVLLLDALLGSSAALARGLGTWLRTERADPGYPAAMLTVQ